MMEPLRAVIADDSAVYRALLLRALGKVGAVEVVAQAANGMQAVEAVRQHRPDLLTLDLNMPIMDGLATLRALREAKLDCEVLVISSESAEGANVALEALQHGAVDFITKPSEESAAASAQDLVEQLRRKLSTVRLRQERRRFHSQTLATAKRASSGTIPNRAFEGKAEAVVIGTSTGGPAALPVVLGALPADFPLPVLVVQHMPPLFTATLADSLNRKSALSVCEGHQGQRIQKGYVYIAPGGHHLKVKRAFDHSVRLVVSDEPPENHCRPAVDILLRSAAEEFRGRVIVAIMTGMGNDGVGGLRTLKPLGAFVIAQSEDTCAVFGMPQEAIRANLVDVVLPLDKIAVGLVAALNPNGH